MSRRIPGASATDRADMADRVMRATSWNRDLDLDVTRLQVRAIQRDMIGWGGVIGVIVIATVLALVLHLDQIPDRLWYSGLAVLTAPFAGWFLVGAWGDSWLTSIKRRQRGVAARPPHRRTIFRALVVTPARTAAALAVVWAFIGVVAALIWVT